MSFPLSQAVCCREDIENFVHAFEQSITKHLHQDNWYQMSRSEFSRKLRERLNNKMMFGIELVHVGALLMNEGQAVIVQITYRAFNGPIQEMMVKPGSSLWWDKK